MHDFWDKEQILNHLAAFEVLQDECEVIIDEDGINIIPTLRSYFIENRKNKETVNRINQIFRGYLQEQFAQCDLEYREILEANLDKLIAKAYENVGTDKEKMQQGSKRVTVGFLKAMLLELKDLVTVIGKTTPIIPPFLNEGSKEKILAIFKNIAEQQYSNILSFNRDLFIPEVFVAEYLMNVANDFGFNEGELVKVPLLNRRGVINQPKRKIINYRVTILPLYRDIFAYGFLPEGDQVPHLLLFCGPYFTENRPRGRSFFKKLQSQCLGYFIYKTAEQIIEDWLTAAESITNHKAILLGHGVGGALVGYTSTYLHPRVQKGMTFDGIEVDSKTTKMWHNMVGEAGRPVLHNFYLENGVFQEMSPRMIGDNFDVLIDEATTQLDISNKRSLGKDVVVCKRKVHWRSPSLTQIGCSFIPIIGSCYHMAGQAWDWVTTRFSAETK